ncbi:MULTISPECIES: inositol monophosphatase family protein [unclassified Pseudoclavibacter]|uniref:inositol monophosphatase family protein n=1 Tax=unclassified Pseudoclavibacter TaxID=2615177 RepID=UPI000CE7676D|nr:MULTISPECIES: inositol monophosphatase family protein [unclassified Pseudoclavibacter]MBS3177607.1 histidinol phosphatase [Pseudoclavibacter sp. Marseille-Q4354]NYF13343.1 histidinol-phosphatase [Pseudoclavibacter sp. JAI123]PPG29618.1 histidinol phosphatase [Pseudoclavibacter sp. RFBB5]
MATELLHPLSSDLRLARELADIADAVSMQHFNSRSLGVYEKEDRTPVTDADRAVEQALRARLAETRPSDSILGEEYGSQGTSRRQWIIDPIDGTANFMRGIPIWATLISLVIDGVPEVGVVSAPGLNRRWWGATGQGAYLDDDLSDRDVATDRRIQVSAVDELERASLSYNSLKGWDDAGRSAQLLEFSRAIWRTRAVGEVWSYMLVAEGALEIAGEFDLQPYDMAAIVPIVVEAGGTFTSMDGEEGPWHGSALATNGLLHDQALKALAAR